jgi:uncharacterized protein YndB with AHSA1/START domain
MRWLLNLAKALLVLLILLAVVGWLLPGQRHVERSIEIPAAPAMVWPWLAEPQRWAAWSPWYAKDPQMQIQYEGPASGEGAGWTWVSKTQGRGHMQFLQAQAPQSLRYALRFDDMGMQATGAFTLSPAGTGTRVVWRLDTELGLNPLARWFGLALDNLVGADFEDGLSRLAKQVVAPPR